MIVKSQPHATYMYMYMYSALILVLINKWTYMYNVPLPCNFDHLPALLMMS